MHSLTAIGKGHLERASTPRSFVPRASRTCAAVQLTSSWNTSLRSGIKNGLAFVQELRAPRRKCSGIEPAAAQPTAERTATMQQQLSRKDRHMVRLYLAGCFREWEQLPDIACELLAAGCTSEELRGCVRHLVVFAGYAPCLAATFTLKKAKLLHEDTPAKCGGPPGNAFELVYADVTDRVRSKMHSADPVLGEWIRVHLYGDVYSSPGLDLRQKQLLACAFLGFARMPDQLFGHAIAGLRFGNSRGELEEAVRLGFQQAATGAGSEGAKSEALKMLDLAYAKYVKDYADQNSAPDITVPAPSSIRVPALPPLFNAPSAVGDEDATVTIAPVGNSGKAARGPGVGNLPSGGSSLAVGGAGWEEQLEGQLAGLEDSDDVVFAWEEVDPRHNRGPGQR